MRRVALRPVAPEPAGATVARVTPPADAPRPLATGLGRGLARWMVPLIVNPTLAMTPIVPAPSDDPPPSPAVEAREVVEEVADPPGAIRPEVEPEPAAAVPALDDGPPARGGREASGRGAPRPGRAGRRGRRLREAIRLDPGLAEAFAGRGQAFVRRGEIPRAIADLDEALRLRPGSAPALNDRGLAELARGDILRGVADLDAALRAAPDSAVIHYNRGVAYSRLGEPDVAIAEFDAAIRLDPNLAVARIARSRAPVRQVSLTRGVSRTPRPADAPAPPLPTANGIAPTPQDPLRPGEIPVPPAPAIPR